MGKIKKTWAKQCTECNCELTPVKITVPSPNFQYLCANCHKNKAAEK